MSGSPVRIGRRFAAIVAGAALAAALGACERAPGPAPEPPPSPTAEPSPPGTIRGRLSYPSDYLPEDLQVCARERSTGDVFCRSRREGKRGYALEVPAGSYEVWAHTRDWPPVRAFYSEFMRCGGTVECTDHTPIEVPVEAGKEAAGVDPGDWYAQLQE